MLRRSLTLLMSMMVVLGALGAGGCADVDEPPAGVPAQPASAVDYRVGAGDQMQVFVWKNPDLTTTVRVRPDGRISAPLIDDLLVSGRTPTQVAHDIEDKLAVYVKDPKVTVIMVDFVGPVQRQVRVIGEAMKAQTFAYRRDMTVLDVMILAGGLTQYAAGNRAVLLRMVDGKLVSYHARLADLMKDGDVSADFQMAPGDILMIPQAWF